MGSSHADGPDQIPTSPVTFGWATELKTVNIYDKDEMKFRVSEHRPFSFLGQTNRLELPLTVLLTEGTDQDGRRAQAQRAIRVTKTAVAPLLWPL